MSDELKPCHLCASVDVEEDKYCISPQPLAMCKNCGYTQFLCDWNTRPNEDALRAELEQTRGELAQTEALLHADCDCDVCPLQDESACDELCASKGTLITRIAEDRAELARKDEEIAILRSTSKILADSLAEYTDSCPYDSHGARLQKCETCDSLSDDCHVDWAIESARARLAEIRIEKK